MESRPVESVSGAQGCLPFKNCYLYFPRLRRLISRIPLTFIRIDGDLAHFMIARYRDYKTHEQT